MQTSINSSAVKSTLAAAKTPTETTVEAGVKSVSIRTPFPSPEDWRDVWIYHILLDRFNNPSKPPSQPWNYKFTEFQGGTFEGVRTKLDYLQSLGAGAAWLSPCMKNCMYLPGTYHGYGIQNFLGLDPRFASSPGKEEEEFRLLVDEAHTRGMYVIADIVLNHTGDVFEYVCDGDKHCIKENGHEAGWRNDAYAVHWRDESGQGRPEWPVPPKDAQVSPDALVWPVELQCNDFFRRRGVGGVNGGDFCSLKELVTASPRVRDILIMAHQYFVARFDVDGFRIDTLMYIERDFARTFGNAMREFGLSIGKKNFFTFGEVWDSEEKIAEFIGRNVSRDPSGVIGVDAALDFPLKNVLPNLAKGLGTPPSRLVDMYEHRKIVEREIMSSHGEASKYFVTFLDNHDCTTRFLNVDDHQYDDQVTLALGCLFSLQGIPCVYYGTEQGLNGTREIYDPNYPPQPNEKKWHDWMVREALWGKQNAFDPQHPFAQTISQLTSVRKENPALRYGRQYFRQLSGDGCHFGFSCYPGGVLAFSRILNDTEVLVVANTNTQAGWSGHAIIDSALNPCNKEQTTSFGIAFSNLKSQSAPIVAKTIDNTEVQEPNGCVLYGDVTALYVELKAMEIRIFRKTG